MKIKNFLVGALVALTGITGLASCAPTTEESNLLVRQSIKRENSSTSEDVLAPTILGPDSLRFGYASPSNLEAILLQYSATDDVDEEVDIVVAEENYIANRTKLGNYSIKLTATDTSGNVGEKVVPVEVYDNVAPLFDAPSKIYKKSSIALTAKDIHAEVKAIDAIDGEREVTVTEDNYTGNGDKAGTYTIHYSSVDESKNTSGFTLPVEVLSNDFPNVWYSHGNMIHVQSNIQLSTEDIVNVFLASGELLEGYSKVEVVASGYTFLTEEGEAENLPGTYTISITARYYTGEEISFARSLDVYESDELIQKVDNWFDVSWKSVFNYVIRHVLNAFVYVQHAISDLFGHEEWKWELFQEVKIYN